MAAGTPPGLMGLAAGLSARDQIVRTSAGPESGEAGMDSPKGRGGRRRAKTVKAKPLTKEEREAYKPLIAEVERIRPRTRADCRNGIRPCPFVSCKYHLYLDVNPKNGHIKFNFPDKEVWELEESCALDVAEREHGITLEEVGIYMNLTRERVRQVEEAGLDKIKYQPPFNDDLEVGEPLTIDDDRDDPFEP